MSEPPDDDSPRHPHPGAPPLTDPAILVPTGQGVVGLHLRDSTSEGQDAVDELFDRAGRLRPERVAQITLYVNDGSVRVITDPKLCKVILSRLPLRPPDEPVADAFPEGQGTVPNNPAVFTTISAIWKGGGRARSLMNGWASSDDGQPVYRHDAANGGRIIVYIHPGRGGSALATTETLWAIVERLSPFTADVALAILAQLCAPEHGAGPKYPLLDPVQITADAILHYKGIQRWGAERHELRQRIAAEIERLRHLSFDVESWPVGGGEQPQEQATWRGDALFDIVTVERISDGFVNSLSWSVRAGQWAFWWLNASGRVFVGRMARTLLELDHRENRGAALLAKKVGQHILLRAGSGQTPLITLTVAQLLGDIGELPVVAARTKDWAGRTRDRLDEALLSLSDSHLFARLDWPDGYGPGDDDRQRGWVERWLDARIHLTLALPTLPAGGAVALPPAPPVALLPPPLPAEEQPITGQAIRRARAARQWKQEQLARHLGITVPYLSQIEGGRRQPSPQLMGRIRAWIAESPKGIE